MLTTVQRNAYKNEFRFLLSTYSISYFKKFSINSIFNSKVVVAGRWLREEENRSGRFVETSLLFLTFPLFLLP